MSTFYVFVPYLSLSLFPHVQNGYKLKDFFSPFALLCCNIIKVILPLVYIAMERVFCVGGFFFVRRIHFPSLSCLKHFSIQIFTSYVMEEQAKRRQRDKDIFILL